MTKPRILEAVREARGEQSAELIDHLKKADMGKGAERLLEGSGWLPVPLRSTTVVPEMDPATEEEALPAFLGGGDATGDPEESSQRAAE